MSGIELDESCVNLFMHMKTRSTVSRDRRAVSTCAGVVASFRDALLVQPSRCWKGQPYVQLSSTQ